MRANRLSLLLILLVGCYGVPDPYPARPVADAGGDSFGRPGVEIALNGSGSTSSAGSPLTYTWSFASVPLGSALSDALIAPNASLEAAQASFVPDLAGRYVVGLMVNDGVTDSVGDFVAFDVSGDLAGPQANAGEDQTVSEGMAVYLDGAGSVADGAKELFYHWTLEGAPGLSTLTDEDLVNRYTPYPWFIADAGGVYSLSLVVSDGVLESEPDYVFVSAISTNVPPIAYAGQDASIKSCTRVPLDGSGSYDIDGDPLEHLWSVLIAPLHSSVDTQSLDDARSAATSFYADLEGTYVIQLEVYDGETLSVPDVIELTATRRQASENASPVVEVGEDLAFSDTVACTGGSSCPNCPPVELTVSGEGTVDPDEDTLTYLWSNASESGLPIVIQNPTQLTTSVTLQGAQALSGSGNPNHFRLTLEATDCPGATSSATLEIVYTCVGTN